MDLRVTGRRSNLSSSVLHTRHRNLDVGASPNPTPTEPPENNLLEGQENHTTSPFSVVVRIDGSDWNPLLD